VNGKKLKLFFILLLVLVTMILSACEVPDPGESPLGGATILPAPAFDAGDVLERINRFFTDARLYIILGLVVVDILFGVWGAIKRNKFDWGKVGQFYQTNVVPYIGGYLTLYVVLGMIPGLEGFIGEGIVTAAWTPIIANLVGSIAENLSVLGINRPAQ